MRIPFQSPAAVFLLIISSVAHAATPPACSLVSGQMAVSLLGKPVRAPIAQHGYSCIYAAQTGIGMLDFTVTSNPGMNEKEFQHEGQMDTSPRDTMETVSDFRESNYLIVKPDGYMNTLAVFHHQKIVTLIVGMKMTPELRAKMIQLMKQVLAQI